MISASDLNGRQSVGMGWGPLACSCDNTVFPRASTRIVSKTVPFLVVHLHVLAAHTRAEQALGRPDHQAVAVV
eukprot:SAG22_NODE_12740_length_431_cov_0.602410_1_plen_72_part_10